MLEQLADRILPGGLGSRFVGACSLRQVITKAPVQLTDGKGKGVDCLLARPDSGEAARSRVGLSPDHTGLFPGFPLLIWVSLTYCF